MTTERRYKTELRYKTQLRSLQRPALRDSTSHVRLTHERLAVDSLCTVTGSGVWTLRALYTADGWPVRQPPVEVRESGASSDGGEDQVLLLHA